MQYRKERGCPARWEWVTTVHPEAEYEPLQHESEGSWLVMLSTPDILHGKHGPGGLLTIHRCRHCECLYTDDPPQLESEKT